MSLHLHAGASVLSAAAAAIFVVATAQAAVIRIAPGVDSAGEGRVSAVAGVTEERFEDGSGGCGATQLPFTSSLVFQTRIAVDRGSIIHERLAPQGDDSCYASFAPVNAGVNALASAGIATPTDRYVDYFGFYLGSVDEYQRIEFYDSLGRLIFLTNERTGTVISEVVEGGQIASGLIGSRFEADFGQPLYQSYYVEIAFTEEDDFGQIILRTSNAALEIDNFAWTVSVRSTQPSAVTPVPAAPAAGVVALGCLSMARRRRR